MKTTIDMAREAGLYRQTHYLMSNPVQTRYSYESSEEQLKAFEALVRSDERNRTWTQEHWTEYERSIAAVERELIAQSMDKQAELAADDIDRQWAQEMAAAIRARGQE
jgi:hypothetical protein